MASAPTGPSVIPSAPSLHDLYCSGFSQPQNLEAQPNGMSFCVYDLVLFFRSRETFFGQILFVFVSRA